MQPPEIKNTLDFSQGYSVEVALENALLCLGIEKRLNHYQDLANLKSVLSNYIDIANVQALLLTQGDINTVKIRINAELSQILNHMINHGLYLSVFYIEAYPIGDTFEINLVLK